MANLTYIEKQRLESLFGMSTGYVLGFSDRTFGEFFSDVVGVDIFAEEYDYHSGSKANRLRAFWTREPNGLVADILESLVEVAEFDGDPDPKLVTFARGIVVRLRGDGSSGGVARPSNPNPRSTGNAHEDRGYEVALSFAGEQRPYVNEVATTLKQMGVRVFYDNFEDLWGKDLTVELERVYRHSSRYVVIFVSEDYVRKVWTNHERQHALAGRIERQDDSVLPARFDSSEIPGLPSSIGYIQLGDFTPTQLAEQICAKLRSEPSP